jgi:two-component system, LytTR family, response regulator
MKTLLKCIIIDDEPSGRLVLRELLDKFCKHVEVVGEAANAAEAYFQINAHQPDFILLDIQMPGEDGFDLLKKFQKVNFDVIFVTSFDKYAINAIRFSALDYLLKPVDVDELVAAVNRVNTEKNLSNKNLGYVNLLNNLDETRSEKKITVHHGDKVKFINLSEILSIEASSNYATLITNKDEKYSTARVLKEFEEMLAAYPQFMRINKSVIINMDYVSEYSKGEPCIIKMSNGKHYELSRRKKTELGEWLRESKD